ncbi:MAG: hypothetical protein K2W82_14890 [Candidatus Obscuribacterales bacterium]|nr:hypothetical protein [Candidatus Obscuribacterales bacterium]
MDNITNMLSENESNQLLLVAKKLSAEKASVLASTEASSIALAILHCSLASSTKKMLASVSSDSAQAATSILNEYLNNPEQYPQIKKSVLIHSSQAAEEAAFNEIIQWGKDKALAKAEAAARTLLEAKINQTATKELQEKMSRELNDYIVQLPSDAKRQKAVEQFLQKEFQAYSTEACQKALTAELRRKAQKAAQEAAATVACEASEGLIKARSELEAKKSAEQTAKNEILNLVTLKSKCQIAKSVNDYFNEQFAQGQREIDPQICGAALEKMINDTVETALTEVSTHEALQDYKELLIDKVRHTALEVADDICQNPQVVPKDGTKQMSVPLFIGIQIVVACLLIWFILFGPK